MVGINTGPVITQFEIELDGLAFAGQLKVGLNVAGAALEILVAGDLSFDALAVAHDWLRQRRVRPQGWDGKLLFDGG